MFEMLQYRSGTYLHFSRIVLAGLPENDSTDIDMLFFERGVRGVVCQNNKRFARENNKDVPNFDPSKPTSYIIYLDSNNLYGRSMCQYLPHGDFEWVDASTLNEDIILAISDTAEEGYVLEMDLEYPQELYDLHNDYLVAPERMTVKEEMLSEYAVSQLGNNKYSTTPKLILNLQDKKKLCSTLQKFKTVSPIRTQAS